jgi:hypothetical protein
MLPEPTLPKRRRGAPAPAQPWAMTPLFAVPDSADAAGAGPEGIASPGRPATGPPGRARRPNSRLPAGKAGPRKAGPKNPHKEPADLLAVTAERLRRALGRSFLRYGIPGDLETAVHAAMNVIEPVLDARDTEILRLRRLMGAKLPGR